MRTADNIVSCILNDYLRPIETLYNETISVQRQSLVFTLSLGNIW